MKKTILVKSVHRCSCGKCQNHIVGEDGTQYELPTEYRAPVKSGDLVFVETTGKTAARSNSVQPTWRVVTGTA
jgi:hypothetical protein